MDDQYCPICNVEVLLNPRYPNHLCKDCAKKPVDENGRELEFFNVSASGGFVAKYKDNNSKRDSHICFVDGVKCYANEARFGGIVIQPVSDE